MKLLLLAMALTWALATAVQQPSHVRIHVRIHPTKCERPPQGKCFDPSTLQWMNKNGDCEHHNKASKLSKQGIKGSDDDGSENGTGSSSSGSSNSTTSPSSQTSNGGSHQGDPNNGPRGEEGPTESLGGTAGNADGGGDGTTNGANDVGESPRNSEGTSPVSDGNVNGATKPPSQNPSTEPGNQNPSSTRPIPPNLQQTRNQLPRCSPQCAPGTFFSNGHCLAAPVCFVNLVRTINGQCCPPYSCNNKRICMPPLCINPMTRKYVRCLRPYWCDKAKVCRPPTCKNPNDGAPVECSLPRVCKNGFCVGVQKLHKKGKGENEEVEDNSNIYTEALPSNMSEPTTGGDDKAHKKFIAIDWN